MPYFVIFPRFVWDGAYDQWTNTVEYVAIPCKSLPEARLTANKIAANIADSRLTFTKYPVGAKPVVTMVTADMMAVA